MEIIYNRENKTYDFLHDGMSWNFEDLKEHFRNNGHIREAVGFGVPPEVWYECREMAVTIEKIFDRKEDISRKRHHWGE